MKISHSSHWGAFSGTVKDGRLVAVKPFIKDDHPSEILQSIPSALYDNSRIAAPMVRAGWLEDGPCGSQRGGRRDRRGGEPFIQVTWDTALDLVASELNRVKDDHGNAAIFGGSF